MLIGELAARTGVPRRLLRYYEEQGMLPAERSANGFRSYDARAVDRVIQIRGLLAAGLPTRVIKLILPCLTQPGVLLCESDASPDVLAALERERDSMTARIETLLINRDAIDGYLAEVRSSNAAV